MSRRPFSHMFFEILNGKGNPNITDKFSSDVLKNKEKFFSLFNENISFADQLSNGFYKANYAEQFFNEKGEPLDLIRLLPYFNDSIRNSSFLNDLLKNGVLSTTMISMMNTEMVTNDVRIRILLNRK